MAGGGWRWAPGIAALLGLGLSAHAAVAQTVPRAAFASNPQVDAWVRDHIDHENWTQVGWAGNTVWFVSSLPVEASGSPLVQDWVRAEDSDLKENGLHSGLMRIEVDCRSLRSRVLEYYHYEHNNLRGRLRISDTPTTTLEAAKPRSIMQSCIQAICRGAR